MHPARPWMVRAGTSIQHRPASNAVFELGEAMTTSSQAPKFGELPDETASCSCSLGAQFSHPILCWSSGGRPRYGVCAGFALPFLFPKCTAVTCVLVALLSTCTECPESMTPAPARWCSAAIFQALDGIPRLDDALASKAHAPLTLIQYIRNTLPCGTLVY